MDNNVLIKRTDLNDDYTTIYFVVPSLNIDSQYKIHNDEFTKQINQGGYKALGFYLLQQLDDGIQAMLRGDTDGE